MSDHQEDINRELEALSALQLLAIRSKDTQEIPEGLEDRMFAGTLEHLSSKTETSQPGINLREAIRREKASSFSLLLRIAAGIAAILMMTTMSYKLLSTLDEDECTGRDKLACLVAQTSDQEIYNYLYESGLPEEEFFFQWMNEEPGSNEPEQIFFEIEMP
jgi:hypothetical protein